MKLEIGTKLINVDTGAEYEITSISVRKNQLTGAWETIVGLDGLTVIDMDKLATYLNADTVLIK